MNSGSQQHNSYGSNNDEVFNGLSKDPLVDAGYGPVSHVPRPSKPKHLLRTILIVVVAIVVIAGLVAGGMALANHHKTTPKTTAKTSTGSTSSNTSSSGASGTVEAAGNAYTSNETSLAVKFNYPTGWTVSPATTTATGTSAITVTSPSSTFTDASGASVTGRAVVTLRPGSAGISELTSGTATVGQNSVQIGYTNPSADQHKYPYITFLHFPSGEKASGAFEEVMITGVTSFSAPNTVTTADLAGLDPVISVNFNSCTGSTCTAPLSITNATWSNNATAVEALNILESMQLN